MTARLTAPPVSYTHLDVYKRQLDEGGREGARFPGAGAPDPRIGRPDRTGTLLVAALFVLSLIHI